LQRARGRAPKTIEKYTLVLNALVEWVASEAKLNSAASFTDRHFWGFNQHMATAGLTKKTCYDRLVVVKQLFKWATPRLIPQNPLAGISMDKPGWRRQPCFTPEQVATLLEQADPHEGAIFAMMAYTGMRFGEVRDLRWTDVLLDQGTHGFIAVERGGSSGTTKSKRVRRIPINVKLRAILNKLGRRSERVFNARPSEKYPKGDGPIDERRLLMSLKRLCKRCGFEGWKTYKLHTFRHAFASVCARNNISHKYALEWMGHTSSAILDLYYTMYDETAEAGIRTIDYVAKPRPRKVPAA
jgi:integrase